MGDSEMVSGWKMPCSEYPPSSQIAACAPQHSRGPVSDYGRRRGQLGEDLGDLGHGSLGSRRPGVSGRGIGDGHLRLPPLPSSVQPPPHRRQLIAGDSDSGQVQGRRTASEAIDMRVERPDIDLSDPKRRWVNAQLASSGGQRAERQDGSTELALSEPFRVWTN